MNNDELLTTTNKNDTVLKTDLSASKKKKRAITRQTISDKTAEKEKRRPNYVPLCEQKRIFLQDADPHYHYHLATIKDDNIESYELAGYEKVEGKALGAYRRAQDPSQLGSYATQSIGGGETGIWMRVPKELYEAEKVKKRNKRKALLRETVLANDVAPVGLVSGNFNVTKESVTINGDF